MLYNFILKNFFLILFFFILLFFLLIFEIRNVSRYRNCIDVNKIIELINHENTIIIDIRSESDFKKVCLLNSINIPLAELEIKIIKFKKYKLKNIIIIHSKVNDALKAINILNKKEFIKVFFIENGIDSWLKNDLPVKRGFIES